MTLLLKVCLLLTAALTMGNSVRFSGESFDFTVIVDGKFEVVAKDSEINQMFAKFVEAKDDFKNYRRQK